MHEKMHVIYYDTILLHPAPYVEYWCWVTEGDGQLHVQLK